MRSSIPRSSTITVWEMKRTRHTTSRTITRTSTTDAGPPDDRASTASMRDDPPRMRIIAQPICVCRYATIEA